MESNVSFTHYNLIICSFHVRHISQLKKSLLQFFTFFLVVKYINYYSFIYPFVVKVARELWVWSRIHEVAPKKINCPKHMISTNQPLITKVISFSNAYIHMNFIYVGLVTIYIGGATSHHLNLFPLSLQFDHWSEMGRLHDLIGSRGTIDMGIHLQP